MPRRKSDMLKMYYQEGLANGGMTTSIDPLDINGASFKPEIYLNKLLKVSSVYCQNSHALQNNVPAGWHYSHVYKYQ